MLKITMRENASPNLSLSLCKHSIKMSQICIILKQLAFFKISSYGDFATTFACLILERNYNSARIVSVKILTFPVAAEPTLRAIKHL